MSLASQPLQDNKERAVLPRVLSRVSPQSRYWVPFLTGLFLAPAFIFLHEAAHFATARALGFEATLHSSETTIHYSHLPPPPGDLLITAAAPLLHMLFGSVGLIWLCWLRRGRRDEPADWRDWVATWLALNAARWIAGPFRGSSDEAFLVKASGLPAPIGLTLLAIVSAGAIIITIRRHPRGSRLVPFIYGLLGGSAGGLFWLHWLGPRLLP